VRAGHRNRCRYRRRHSLLFRRASPGRGLRSVTPG
jgi:hypothetical protein